MGCSTTALFHSFSLHPCTINVLPFCLCLWLLSKRQKHILTGLPIGDADYWVEFRAGSRAWLQLPHMTSPFAPDHSLHLPSPGCTMDKECLKCVCVCVIMRKRVDITKRHVMSSSVLFHLLHILCARVVIVCGPWARLDKMAVQLLGPGTQGHKFTVSSAIFLPTPLLCLASSLPPPSHILPTWSLILSLRSNTQTCQHTHQHTGTNAHNC